MTTELDDRIRQHNQDEMTASLPSVERQSINQQVDGPVNGEPASFIKEHDESRRTSNTDTIKTYHQGIYWRSPITMVTFFVLGDFYQCLSSFVLYYNSHEGHIVHDREWVIGSVTTSRDFFFLRAVSYK